MGLRALIFLGLVLIASGVSGEERAETEQRDENYGVEDREDYPRGGGYGGGYGRWYAGGGGGGGYGGGYGGGRCGGYGCCGGGYYCRCCTSAAEAEAYAAAQAKAKPRTKQQIM